MLTSSRTNVLIAPYSSTLQLNSRNRHTDWSDAVSTNFVCRGQHSWKRLTATFLDAISLDFARRWQHTHKFPVIPLGQRCWHVANSQAQGNQLG